MKLGSLCILFFFCISCSDIKKGKQLEQIEWLQSSLDSLEKEWNPGDATTIDSLADLCLSKIDSIGLFYDDQQIELSQASKIDLFKQCNSDLHELKEIHTFYPVVLKEKKQSLKLLKEDVGKGSGRRERYEEYIEFEQKELATIRQQHNDYQKTKKRCLSYYSESKKAVDELLDSLKKQYQAEIVE